MNYLLLTQTDNELYHHGIKGMHWGIRRFQPYQPGAKVKGGKEVGAATKVKQKPSSGGIVEHFKTRKAEKAKAAAIKKAQATRKANTEFAASKEKAINSGTIDDLAKFKGKLTNEEYQRAFQRLQNEKKLEEMVSANQKTIWDKIDKGMSIVQKVGGYANTIATFKENTDRMTDALNKKKDKAEEKAKNTALAQVTNLTELNKVQKEFNLNIDEYSKGVKNISNKKANEKLYGFDFVDKNTPVDGEYRKANTPAPTSKPQPEQSPQAAKPDSKPASQPLTFKGQTTVDANNRTFDKASSLNVKDVKQTNKGPSPTTSLAPSKNNDAGLVNTSVLAVNKSVMSSGKSFVQKNSNASWESMTKEQKAAAVRKTSELMGIKSIRPTADYNWDSIKSSNKSLLDEAYKRSLK